ncbi:acyltransferase family protein [Enterobacter cloacae]|uniref:acyltransferase family protein n=1 Tax=Enterobacter cloacae TaxID=550 RepID=UPI0031DCA35B
MTSYNNFRYDINGLRALAVIAVVIFHFDSAWMPAGFVGVDIFFAISGYLMTSIIYKGIFSDNFSILSFYAARFKRIVPALILMVSFVIIAGYFLIEPYDYQKIGIHSRDSLLFISNITYLNESGYFDVDSLEKFLLHTWSLSVEWQFYIIYPLIIIGVAKLFGKSNIKYAVLFLFLASFFISVFVTKKYPSQSYYMIHTRGWEMMAGGLAYLFPLTLAINAKRVVYYSALAMNIFSIWLFTSNTSWPGSAAAVPVLSTAIILSIRGGKEVVLGNAVAQLLGKLSYSIYLFHWPLLVFSRKLNIDLPFALYISLTLILSCISYNIIEKRRLKVVYIIPFFICAIILSQYIANDGLSSRVDKKAQERSKNYNEFYNPWMIYRNVQNNPIFINPDNGNTQFILTGDSYALMYVKAMDDKGLHVDVYANESCNASMFSSAYTGGKSCQRMKALLKKRLTEDSNTPLLISQSWDIYLGELDYKDAKKEVDAFMDSLSAISKQRKIYVLGTYHQPSYNPYTCLLNNKGLKSNFLTGMLNTDKCPSIEDKSKDLTKSKVNIDELLKSEASNYNNIIFLSIKDDQCKSDTCTIIENGEPVIVRPHLTKYGSDKYTEYLLKKMSD